MYDINMYDQLVFLRKKAENVLESFDVLDASTLKEEENVNLYQEKINKAIDLIDYVASHYYVNLFEMEN